jgi:hypothetical protein
MLNKPTAIASIALLSLLAWTRESHAELQYLLGDCSPTDAATGARSFALIYEVILGIGVPDQRFYKLEIDYNLHGPHLVRVDGLHFFLGDRSATLTFDTPEPGAPGPFPTWNAGATWVDPLGLSAQYDCTLTSSFFSSPPTRPSSL